MRLAAKPQRRVVNNRCYYLTTSEFGTKQTWCDVRVESVMRNKADIH